MTRHCSCGGRFRRCDLIRNKDGTFSDTDPLKATWRCSGCGNIRTQRKRQPRTLIFRLRLNKEEPMDLARQQITEFLSKYGEVLK